jgi:aspartyl-tRNA(Asn)/glutamyl-tRNA(Gln) amidotransferase subunit A
VTVDEAFQRIDRCNMDLHFCEDLVASGPVDRATVPTGGALSGWTVGLKSNLAVAGQAWTAGIGARAERLAEVDAPVVARLRAAGAILVSRLAMDEGALGAATDNPHFGRCENPAWPGHSAGGSSGGSAAAVAAGAVDAALGSDTMGSVRIPAAYCGVYGLKLGSGSVPMRGVFPLAPSLDALGVFARQPGQIADLLQVLIPQGLTGPVLKGWMAAAPSDLARCAPEVQAFLATSHAILCSVLGAPAAMPTLDFPALRSDAFLLTEVEAVESLGAEPGLSHGLTRLLDYGRALDVAQVAQVRIRLEQAADRLRMAMAADRVILLPTVAEPAFAHGCRPPAGQADFTVLANIAGCPAIAIPDPAARPPVSVQLIGPKGSEAALVGLAHRLSAGF